MKTAARESDGVIDSTTRNLASLNRALQHIEVLLRTAVARADSSEHDPTDALRGLVVTPDEIARYLNHPGMSGLWAGTDAHFEELVPAVFDDPHTEIGRLSAMLDLPTVDQYLLLIALAPELDRRYERIYAYLQDDVSLRRPSVNLAMNLLGRDPHERFLVWMRLTPESPLRRWGLIELNADPARANAASLMHLMRVEPRVVSYVMGSALVDERIRRIVRVVEDAAPPPDLPIGPIADSLPESPMVYFGGLRELGQVETAFALCRTMALPLLAIDAALATQSELPDDVLARVIAREGLLHGAALFVDHWDALLESEYRPLLTALWERLSTYPLPVFISGERDWEPPEPLLNRRMLRLAFELPAFPYREALWIDVAKQIGARASRDDVSVLAGKFRFGAARIRRAAQTAADIAASRGAVPDIDDLYAGAQAHATLSLGHLASRITPKTGWNDLILPPDPLAQLHELCDRMKYGYVVRDQWGFGSRSVRGISALFAGESGTGKTLAAEVVAHELGLVLYKIDLSAVVSKYIGETEKNLNLIFNEAQSGNAILFFDEADALFGKRSEVKDARDRYANIEVAYLLQRVEAYDGVVILATNFRQNIDDAFTRRLDFLVDFPFPTPEYRQRIWAAHFPPNAPIGQDVSLPEIAEEYRLAGGSIRNAALAAAYLAAADGQVITAQHIRNAVRRENQKMGRLLDV